nr:ABC transporter substrate binding protein [Micromonospora sp. DSM 115978]
TNANGDPTLIQSIARDLSRSDADLIAVIGTPAVIAMAQADSTHPIIAVAMGDPVGGQVADSLDAPGRNVTGTIDYIDPAQLLDQLADVSPAPARIGTIFDPSNENREVWISALREDVVSRDGVSLVEATVA